ncbi:MAG: Si-specific NAD(P)(+) transhydrogenase [Gaiellales bacterium]|jgi:NAD(P) transhydrogenase|nr:Si-specific NAD(P)(+) transhydrogenase [Gaiellales bacterium]
MSFDLVAVGSGPAGQRAAVQAAKLGKRAAVIERANLGGVSTNFGTVPSKTLRAAIVELTGRAATAQGLNARINHSVTIDDLRARTRQVIEHEREVIRDQLLRNGVTIIEGDASFAEPNSLEVRSDAGTSRVAADRIVIAVGTVPARPPGVEFDEKTVLDSDGLLRIAKLPGTLTVVGAGVIGLEYASMAAALGVHVTLVEKRPRLLDFVDDEMVEALQYHLRGLGLSLRLGEEVDAVRRSPQGVMTHLRSGKRIPSQVVLYAAGRQGATATLNLEAAGLEADSRGRIEVGPDYRTSQPHIFAAGDVIGFPSLAATSMEQGRLAALTAFDRPAKSMPNLLPYGIYTVPEISFVGLTERELTESAVPYVVGFGRFRELVRGGIAGDRTGVLKLLIHTDTRRVLGVHVFGTAATELVHLGQTVMAGDLTVDYLVEAVFNVPTFTDAYKVAALDAANRLNEIDDLPVAPGV